MNRKKNTTNPSNGQLLLRYLGFAGQVVVLLAAAVALGWFLDSRFIGGRPVCVFLLPLVALVVLLRKAVIDTKKV